MDALYWTGAVIACVALVLVSAIIPWAVYTRYVLEQRLVLARAAGGAADGRHHLHRRGQLLSPAHPHEHDGRHRPAAAPLRAASAVISELLMGVVALFMLVWGMKLVHGDVGQFGR